MEKNKIISGIFYILGLLPFAGRQYLPTQFGSSFIADNPNMMYVGSAISIALGLFFTWRAKKQVAKAMEQANQQMAQAQQQYQSQTKSVK